jgi:hypothetical protein
MKPLLLRHYNEYDRDFNYAIKDVETGNFLYVDKMNMLSFTPALIWYPGDGVDSGNGVILNITELYNTLKCSEGLLSTLGANTCLAFIATKDGDVKWKVTRNDFDHVRESIAKTFNNDVMSVAICVDGLFNWYSRVGTGSSTGFGLKSLEVYLNNRNVNDAITYFITKRIKDEGFNMNRTNNFNQKEDLIDVDENGNLDERSPDINRFNKLPPLHEYAPTLKRDIPFSLMMNNNIRTTGKFCVLPASSAELLEGFTKVGEFRDGIYMFVEEMAIPTMLGLIKGMDNRDFWLWDNTDGVKLMEKAIDLGYYRQVLVAQFEITADGVSAYHEKHDTMVNLNEDEKENPYHLFFRNKLEEYNIDSPSDLNVEDRVKFFNDVKEGWKGKKKNVKLNESAGLTGSIVKYNDIFHELLDKYKVGSFTRLPGSSRKKFMEEVEKGIEELEGSADLKQLNQTKKQSITKVKPEEGKMHEVLGVDKNKKISDVYKSGASLAKALIGKVGRGKAAGMINYAANISSREDVFDEASRWLGDNPQQSS